jgi:hypothetical protein
MSGGRAKLGCMPDLAGMLLRRSLGSLSSTGGRCHGCQRTPLAGERMHEMDSGHILCDLCLLQIPEQDRRAVSVQRVHASERHLKTAPKARVAA